MAFGAEIIKDSISPHGVRLTTFEVTIPRIVLAELNTHREKSRNSASSRAIPVDKMIQRVMEDPYIPTTWGKNQKGMQAEHDLTPEEAANARDAWLAARNSAVVHAKELLAIGLHKQLTNRLLEPFMWHTCIISVTQVSNFFHLRNNKGAHPDIQIPARLMQDLYDRQSPTLRAFGDWHLPYVTPSEQDEIGDVETCIKVSTARCARVSYLTHDGKRNIQKDVELYDSLLANGHMSPFEHAARPLTQEDVRGLAATDPGGPRPDAPPEHVRVGNFKGWLQHRKTIPYEDDILAVRT